MSTDPLTLLAAADPASVLAPLSGDELAARRASVPTPPLGVQRTARRRRPLRGTVIAFAAVGVVASGAVAGGYHPWERDVSRQVGPGPTGTQADEVFQREYADARRKLELPPGGVWPARSIPPDSIIAMGRGGQGESTAVMVAIAQWSCFATAEERAGRRSSARAAALSVVSLLRDHVVVVPSGTPEDGAAPSSLPGPIAQFADDGGKAFILRAARKASQGDGAELARFCRANAAAPAP
jgi:hypothetical protein